MEIIASKVCKEIDGKFILNDINIKVESGSIYGLIGPNGAGKTTFARLLLNIYNTTSGKLIVDGIDVQTKDFEKMKPYISCVMDNLGLYKDLTASENVEFFHRIYFPKATDSQRKKDIGEALKLFELSEKAVSKINFFSKGERQRLALARASINNPKLLILDEPTTGLDVQGILIVRRYLQNMKNQGVTVLINSHNLSELEKVCDYYGFINKGVIVKQGNLEELKENFKNDIENKNKEIELEDIYKEIFDVR